MQRRVTSKERVNEILARVKPFKKKEPKTFVLSTKIPIEYKTAIEQLKMFYEMKLEEPMNTSILLRGLILDALEKVNNSLVKEGK